MKGAPHGSSGYSGSSGRLSKAARETIESLRKELDLRNEEIARLRSLVTRLERELEREVEP